MWRIRNNDKRTICLLVALLAAGCGEDPGLEGAASRELALHDGLQMQIRAGEQEPGLCVKLRESYDRVFPAELAELCFNLDLGWQWSDRGPVEGKTCISFAEPDDASPEHWADNYLCYGGEGAEAADDVVIRWSHRGPYPTMSCLKVECEHCQPAEAWEDNYLCHATAPGKHLYRKLGGEDGWLRDPLPPEKTVLAADGVGGVQHFKHGTIYWHPRLGAFDLPWGAWERWIKLGGAGGAPGLPIAGAEVLGHGPTRVNRFQHGDIFDVPGVARAYYLHGPILERYNELGWGPGDGVHPVTEATPLSGGGERVVFSNGAAIHHLPGRGTFVVASWIPVAHGADRPPGAERIGGLEGYPVQPFGAAP